MKVVIPGGSGQVGTVLARAFHGDGHDVVVLSRRPGVEPWRVVEWDGQTLGSWRNEIDGCDVVIPPAYARSFTIQRPVADLGLRRAEAEPRFRRFPPTRLKIRHVRRARIVQALVTALVAASSLSKRFCTPP